MPIERAGRSAALLALTTLMMPTIGTDAAGQSPPSDGFTVGEPFPTMAFPALDGGEPRSITEFRGEKLILHVFASW